MSMVINDGISSLRMRETWLRDWLMVREYIGACVLIQVLHGDLWVPNMKWQGQKRNRMMLRSSASEGYHRTQKVVVDNYEDMAMGQKLVPLKLIVIGFDPPPYEATKMGISTNYHGWAEGHCMVSCIRPGVGWNYHGKINNWVSATTSLASQERIPPKSHWMAPPQRSAEKCISRRGSFPTRAYGWRCSMIFLWGIQY